MHLDLSISLIANFICKGTWNLRKASPQPATSVNNAKILPKRCQLLVLKSTITISLNKVSWHLHTSCTPDESTRSLYHCIFVPAYGHPSCRIYKIQHFRTGILQHSAKYHSHQNRHRSNAAKRSSVTAQTRSVQRAAPNSLFWRCFCNPWQMPEGYPSEMSTPDYRWSDKVYSQTGWSHPDSHDPQAMYNTQRHP